jgi:hypothetical protein
LSIGIAGVAVALAVSSLLPWAFVAPSAGSGGDLERERVFVSLDPASVSAARPLEVLPTERPRRVVLGVLQCRALPPGAFCELVDLRGTLEYPDGTRLEVRSSHGRTPSVGLDTRLLGGALGGIDLVNGFPSSRDGFRPALPDEALYRQLAGKPRSFARRRPFGSASAPGGRASSIRRARWARESERIAIDDVARDPGQCRVVVVESGARLLFARPRRSHSGRSPGCSARSIRAGQPGAPPGVVPEHLGSLLGLSSRSDAW